MATPPHAADSNDSPAEILRRESLKRRKGTNLIVAISTSIMALCTLAAFVSKDGFKDLPIYVGCFLPIAGGVAMGFDAKHKDALLKAFASQDPSFLPDIVEACDGADPELTKLAREVIVDTAPRVDPDQAGLYDSNHRQNLVRLATQSTDAPLAKAAARILSAVGTKDEIAPLEQSAVQSESSKKPLPDHTANLRRALGDIRHRTAKDTITQAWETSQAQSELQQTDENLLN